MKIRILATVAALAILCVATAAAQNSAGGIGVGVDYYKSNQPNDSYHNAAFNLRGQITPLGITVGRRLFGFAEFGYGAQGIIVGGIGYKF